MCDCQYVYVCVVCVCVCVCERERERERRRKVGITVWDLYRVSVSSGFDCFRVSCCALTRIQCARKFSARVIMKRSRITSFSWLDFDQNWCQFYQRSMCKFLGQTSFWQLFLCTCNQRKAAKMTFVRKICAHYVDEIDGWLQKYRIVLYNLKRMDFLIINVLNVHFVTGNQLDNQKERNFGLG